MTISSAISVHHPNFVATVPPTMMENGKGQRHDRTALILYGSETGNSQDVADELGRVAERLHFVTRVSEIDGVELNLLPKYSVVIFAISTTGQGEFPKNARKFWKSLLRKRLPPGCLDHVSFTTFGLGDSSYPKFNFAARKLHKRLEQLGAKEIYPRGEADEQHEEGIDGTFLSWSIDLRKHLLTLFPLPDGVTPIPQEILLSPKFMLKLLDAKSEPDHIKVPSHLADDNLTRRLSSQVSRENITSNNLEVDEYTMLFSPPPAVDEPTPCPQLKEYLGNEVDPADSKLPSPDWIPVPDAFRVRLMENKRVTPEDHWQDVRLLTLYMEAENEYGPGDTITIFPKNFPEDVQSLIDLMDWNEVADEPLRFEVTTPDLFADPLLVTLPSGLYPLKDSTLRQLLTHNLDITAIPKPFFFQYISHFTSDPIHKERLQELGDSAFRDEFYDYATRPRRSILEVLADFPSVKLPYQDVGCAFPFIRGRQFSICSGGLGKQVGRPTTLAKTEPDHLVKVQLLVAIVKYKTVLRKIRQGLCSRYIASLKPDSLLNIKMDSNYDFYKTAEGSPHCPIIMVAAGTGVAPCRSLIWDRSSVVAMRALRDDSPPVGENVLIYGSRNKDKDFFFKDEWASAALRTQVFTAFSRDQREKIYVQDVIRRESKKLLDLIMDGAIIYVCGSSGNMPKAVRESFLDAIMMHGVDSLGAPATREYAEKLLERLEKLGYYVQETW